MLTCHMRKTGDLKQGVCPAMGTHRTKMEPTVLPPRTHEKGPQAVPAGRGLSGAGHRQRQCAQFTSWARSPAAYFLAICSRL